jgi:hypothetical protein
MFEWLIAAAFAASAADLHSMLRAADAPRVALAGSRIKVHAILDHENAASIETDITLYIGHHSEALAVFRDQKGRQRKLLFRGDESWLIAPGAKHPVKIPPEQRLYGSASFAEIARLRLARDYSAMLIRDDAPCGNAICRELAISARNDDAPYDAGTILLDDHSRMVSAEFRVASGKPVKSLEISYRRDAERRSIPARMVVTDLLNPKSPAVTTLTYGYTLPIDDDPKRFDLDRLSNPE